MRRTPVAGKWSIRIGAAVLIIMIVACFGAAPWTLSRVSRDGAVDAASPRRYEAANLDHALAPPFWINAPGPATAADDTPPRYLLGADRLGRSVLVRCLTGGMVSMVIGASAALLAVGLGVLYGATAGAAGGRIDGFMMRIVDVLYGLPAMLLVVLLAVAADGVIERLAPAAEQAGVQLRGPGIQQVLNVALLVVAIGGLSWLTMARVIRGQVLSLMRRPFMEASRAIGVPRRRQFRRHLLPNLIGPIVVYATLTAPAAILSESFLSFLGIGVREPLPSWGGLAADGLNELNTVKSRWWLLVFPCALIALTLLALNMVGEGLRDRWDPRRREGHRAPAV